MSMVTYGSQVHAKKSCMSDDIAALHMTRVMTGGYGSS
jgi:hypothetical protein